MEAKRVEPGPEVMGSVEPEDVTHVSEARSWESFPKPSGWSLAWDERGLTYEASRHNHRNGKSEDS